MLLERKSGFDMGLKGVEVPVIDANDCGAGINGSGQFFSSVNFNQGIQIEAGPKFDILFELVVCQAGNYE